MTTAKTTYTIPGAVLNAVNLFTTTNDVRFYLEGIHLYTMRANGPLRLEASNGHIAIQVEHDDWTGELDQILAVPKVKTRSTYAFRPAARTKLGIDEGSLTDTKNGSTIPLELIDARFPDVDRVMPALPDSIEPRKPQPIDARYLEIAGKAIAMLTSAFGVKYSQTDIYYGKSEQDPVLVANLYLPNVRIGIMPMRR